MNSNVDMTEHKRSRELLCFCSIPLYKEEEENGTVILVRRRKQDSGSKMRSYESWVLLMAMVVAVVFFAFGSRIAITDDRFELPSVNSPTVGNEKTYLDFHSNRQVVRASSSGNRKLKENLYRRRTSTVSMEDYPRYDPVPSSKASVKPGPIDHGAPLMPYLPSPTPPGPPKRGGGVP